MPSSPSSQVGIEDQHPEPAAPESPTRPPEIPSDIAEALLKSPMPELRALLESQATLYRDDQPDYLPPAPDASTVIEQAAAGGRAEISLAAAALLNFRLSESFIAEIFQCDDLESGKHDDLSCLIVTDPTHSLVQNLPQGQAHLAALVRVLDEFDWSGGLNGQIRQFQDSKAVTIEHELWTSAEACVSLWRACTMNPSAKELHWTCVWSFRPVDEPSVQLFGSTPTNVVSCSPVALSWQASQPSAVGVDGELLTCDLCFQLSEREGGYGSKSLMSKLCFC